MRVSLKIIIYKRNIYLFPNDAAELPWGDFFFVNGKKIYEFDRFILGDFEEPIEMETV